ncbi:hypothetical protein [Streptomyces sp. KL116D]|uniref:hypothetical protein n=1 Tax=Streptomyces sp. KL116D TaxID=3045152 RepID=UPI003556A1AF
MKRTDGSTQLTLAGWPLYRYAEDDEAPGGVRAGGRRDVVRGDALRGQESRIKPLRRLSGVGAGPRGAIRLTAGGSGPRGSPRP